VIFLFRQKTPGNIFALLIFGLLLKMPLFLFPKPPVTTQNDAALYQGLVRWLSSFGASSALLASLIAFALLYVQALMLTYLINEFRMLGKPGYLPGAAYLLLTTLLPEWSFLSSPLVAATFIVWALIKLLRLYNLPVARGILFNTGLLLGLSSYVYFPAASFLICFLVGIMVLKPFRLNELVLFLLGCLTPYYFYGAYLFLTDQFSLANFLPHLSISLPAIKSTVWMAVSTLFLTIPFLLGGFFVQSHLHKMLIQVRKNWSIVLLYVLLAFFVPFVNTHASFANWVLVAAPFACFHAAAYFYLPRLWVANVLFFLTVAYIVYLQYWTVLWR
jgi:hypothetical protein